jgi:farnesyl-diphosphate farnesyltransferase
VHREPALSQLLRLDEVLAAFVLARVRPLRSNAARASGAAAEDRDLEFCSDVLGRVSRSFAGVIGQLPPALLADVMVFYLVLRALDTVEDDTAIDAKAKITALEGFARRALLDPPGSWSPPDAGEGDEKLLLQEFDKVRRVYDRLPPASRKVIADVTDEMARGMASFAGRDFRQGTADLEEYDLYCHYVAGLVGEGLSRLFAASGLESDPILASPDQRLSDQMGLFLQKTNIIRDYLEDYVDGRAFWPQSVWR